MFEDSKETKVPVKMIANRDLIRDSIYSTGEWNRGQVQLVPESIAKKMFTHVDTYAPASAEEASKGAAKEVKKDLKKTAEEQAEQARQELVDSIAMMNREAVIEYANVHYSQKIAGNVSVESARVALVAMIDQYGVQ